MVEKKSSEKNCTNKIFWLITGILLVVLYSIFYLRIPRIDMLDSTYVTECTNNLDYAEGGGSLYIIDSFNGNIINLTTATGTPITDNFTYKDKLSDAMAKDICANHTIPPDHNAFMEQVKNDPNTPIVEDGVPNYVIKIYKETFEPSFNSFLLNIVVIGIILSLSIWLWRRK